MKIVGYIGILTMHEIEEDLIVMKVEKEDKLFSRNAKILDILQEIVENLMTNSINRK